jgi:hypothetical protein
MSLLRIHGSESNPSAGRGGSGVDGRGVEGGGSTGRKERGGSIREAAATMVDVEARRWEWDGAIGMGRERR